MKINEIEKLAENVLGMPTTVAQEFAKARINEDWLSEFYILKQHMRKKQNEEKIEESLAVRLARSLPTYSNQVDESLLKPYM